MTEVSRRALVGGAVAVAASAISSERVHAQFVWQRANWQASDFDTLIRSSRRIKQVIHAHNINGAGFLRNAKNSLNGIHFGSGVVLGEIQIICTLNGQANVINYGDYAWEKYSIGEWAKVNDPMTGKPAVRNIFYPSTAGTSLHYASDDPSSDGSAYQDTSIEGLQARGVCLLSCHSSTEELARALRRQNRLSADPENTVKDIEAHMLPGVLIVPSVAGPSRSCSARATTATWRVRHARRSQLAISQPVYQDLTD